jgi:site-specific DNA-methyltransferase (adenine-specific)
LLPTVIFKNRLRDDRKANNTKQMIDIRLSDNLELMAEMQDNTVDLIYCDILYGTGRKFKDYQDLKPKREVIEEHYVPRIKEMHRILKDTGSIYLQMDTRINHWVRCIMDDFFGYDNFLNEISWCYTMPNAQKYSFKKQHDVILFYKKQSNIFNIQRIPYKSGLHHNCNNFKYSTPVTPEIKAEKERKGKALEDWWVDIYPINPASKERNYNTKKPKALIERIIKASSNEGDLVADFYAGSFTTAEVCKDLNRNFIGCDISEKAVQIGHARVSGGF